jgi:uncharacterized membrane protein YfcA
MFEARVGAGIGHPIFLPALALMGLVVGFVAGMFGIGGGFMLTPALMYVFGVPAPIAVGSALCQTCGTSIASFLKYRHLKRGEPRMDLIMLGGSLLGMDAGTRILGYLSGLGYLRSRGGGDRVPVVQVVLAVLFIVLLSATAVFIFHDVWKTRNDKERKGDVSVPGPLVTHVRIPPYIDLPNVGLRQVSMPMICYLGFLLGVASGVMGIGGGILFTPLLLYGFGFSVRNAAGTGILLLFATSVLGTIEQAIQGHVSLKLSMMVLVGSSVGTQFGALTTHYLPNRRLRLILMFLILLVIAVIAWNLARAVGI